MRIVVQDVKAMSYAINMRTQQGIGGSTLTDCTYYLVKPLLHDGTCPETNPRQYFNLKHA
jgi:hypothetical protein